MPQNSASAASDSTITSRFWATLQFWFPTPTNAWAQATGLTLTVDVTDSGQQLLTTRTEQFPQSPGIGASITIDLDVPVGPDRIFTVTGFDRSRDLRFQGKSTPISLTAGQPAAVNITVFQILAILTPSLPNGTVGVTYFTPSEEGFVTLSASGGTPPYTWSVVENLPPAPGLSLCPNELCPSESTAPTAGQITGVPTTAGTFTRTYRVLDSVGTAATKALSLSINTQLTIDTTTLPDGIISQDYNVTVAASGGTPPYTWSIINDGVLSKGLNLTPSTGQITGVPTQTGTFTNTFQVQDSVGLAVTKDLTIIVNPALAIVTTSLPVACLDIQYNVKLLASGGAPPYRWSIVTSPAVALTPAPGLSLKDDLISGIPIELGLVTRTYLVQDTLGVFRTRDLSINVVTCLAF